MKNVVQDLTSAGLLGVWGKWVKHTKYIYNIQDFNPEQVLAVGYTKSKFITDAMMWFDKFSCKRSDLVITVGRDLVETVENRFKGKKVPKTVMINNWIDENEIYSPLNGTGLKPVTRTLKEMGYTNITVVKEQEQPDGKFPTCSYPNPEIKEAMALGMEYAKKCNADLLLATDPDCDRVGIAVKNKAGEYELLTGNQTGMPDKVVLAILLTQAQFAVWQDGKCTTMVCNTTPKRKVFS